MSAEAPLSFRGATLHEADFSHATLRRGQFEGMRITDAWLVDVQLWGMVRTLTVNGVDVTDYVQAELDRRLPARALIRSMTTADACRAGWTECELVWATTIDRARALSPGDAHAHVDDEWSLVETIRHMVFVVDAWAQRTLLDLERPFHPLGWPHTAYPPHHAAEIGLQLDAAVSLDDAVAAWDSRCEVMRSIVRDLRDEDLERVCTRTPAPGYPVDQVRPVGLCLRVVMDEALEHSAYANRDLDALAAA